MNVRWSSASSDLSKLFLLFIGCHRIAAARRSIPRLFRNQGREILTRRPSVSSYWYESLVLICTNPFLNLPTSSGRIAGQDGKTKFTIENASRTRIVLADTYVGFHRALASCWHFSLQVKFISWAHSKTSKLHGMLSYLSSWARLQGRFMLDSGRLAVACDSVRCDICTVANLSRYVYLVWFCGYVSADGKF